MTYREYLNRDGSISRKNIPGTRYQPGTPDKPDPFYQPDALIDAKIAADEVMDSNEFYAWSKSIPVEVVLNHSKFIAAIYEKIAEIKAMNEAILQERARRPVRNALATLKLTNRILDEISEQELEDLLDNREVGPHWSDDPKLWSVSERAK